MSTENVSIHNTLTGSKETLKTIKPGRIKMYVCGVTPYDEPHLGHARCYVFFDTVRRFFISLGYQVKYVQNFTDIDDKIIVRAKKLNRRPIAVASQYIEDYFDKMKRLNIKRANHYPRVSESIPDTVQFIQKLIHKGMAYPLEGDVYFHVREFKKYGKLSKRSVDEMMSGARVEVNDKKKDPLDFALWKKAKPGEPSWESPWGPGRPGWHIECSVMSIKHLGSTFDIHGGGQDLIFPHHENEIAQSEGLTGKIFANYWLHNAFVTLNKEKMSKSSGNFFTLGKIFEKHDPTVVRFFLLSRHYHSPLDFAEDLLEQSKSAYHTLQEINTMTYFLFDGEITPDTLLNEWKEKFFEAMKDDFNTEKAISIVFELRNAMVEKIKSRDLEWLKKARYTLHYFCDEILGVPLKTSLTKSEVKKIKEKLKLREEARKSKDFKAADSIRDELKSLGYSIEDSAHGPLIKPVPK